MRRSGGYGFVVFGLAAWWTGGCGPDTLVVVDAGAPVDTGADVAQESQEQRYCEMLTSRGCGGSGSGGGVCDASSKCIYGRFMGAATYEKYALCRSAPSCKGDDICIEIAAAEVGGADATKYLADCNAKYAACGKTPDLEVCNKAVYFRPSSQQEQKDVSLGPALILGVVLQVS
jgi:hypothetical protein